LSIDEFFFGYIVFFDRYNIPLTMFLLDIV
jgi:hypothetical protein